MRSAVAAFFLLTAASATAADLSDIQTFLGQTAYDEAQISPDGARLAFIARRNDFEHDREIVTLWPSCPNRNPDFFWRAPWPSFEGRRER